MQQFITVAIRTPDAITSVAVPSLICECQHLQKLRHGKCQNDQTGKPPFDMLLLSEIIINISPGIVNLVNLFFT